MNQAIDTIIYDTDTAEVLASKVERLSTTQLYKTKTGKYFKYVSFNPEVVNLSNKIQVLSVDEAIKLYNKLSERFVDFREAFSMVEFSDA